MRENAVGKDKVPLCEARRSMTEEAARRTAKLLARCMGITFYAVRSRYGRFLAVQVPSDDWQDPCDGHTAKERAESVGRVIGRQTVLHRGKGADRRASGALVPKTRYVRALCSPRKPSPASTF